MKDRNTIIKILVCDDDPQDRKLMRTYLQQKTDRAITALEARQTSRCFPVVGKKVPFSNWSSTPGPRAWLLTDLFIEEEHKYKSNVSLKS